MKHFHEPVFPYDSDMDPRSNRRRLQLGASLLAALVCAGTAGYMLIEGWSLLDAMYQTVTTLSTVGFREVHDLSDGGRIFTMALIVCGVGAMLYTVTAVAESLIEGGVLDALGVRRRHAQMERMHDHVVLCGAGRVGLEIAHELASHEASFVVVDPSAEAAEAVRRAGYSFLPGDGSDESVLRETGIERASVLIAAVDNDAINTFITLTARALNPHIFIVARADAPSTEARLRQAGADRVISPLAVGGRRMALSALRPAIVDFMDTLLGRGHETILAEIQVQGASKLAGAEIGSALGAYPSVRALALQGAEGLVVGPGDNVVLAGGMRLFVVGLQGEVEALTGQAN